MLDVADTWKMSTYIALLFIYVTNLEPNVGIGKRTWRIAQDAIKATEALFVLGLLLVDNPQSEKNFVGFVEV
jgi:hypothetical protein